VIDISDSLKLNPCFIGKPERARHLCKFAVQELQAQGIDEDGMSLSFNPFSCEERVSHTSSNKVQTTSYPDKTNFDVAL